MGMNWLLLRGLVREQRHWGDFPGRLAERTGATVRMLDLPGVGTERQRPSPVTIAAIVEDLRARFTPGDGPWGLLAASLGGMIALAWAERHPEDFARVVVLNTSASDLAGTFDRFTPAALGMVARALWAGDPVVRERHILGLVSNTPQGRAYAEVFAAHARDAPVARGVLVRQLRAASGARAPASLAVPLLVLCSEQDRLCRPGASRALAARLGARLEVHPDAGHDLPLDDPDWVIEQVCGAARPPE